MVRTPVTQHAGAMTTTPPPSSSTEPPVESTTESSSEAASDSGHEGGPRVTRDEVRDLGRLRRTIDDRKVAGVAGGLARHLDIDPIILRVGFVVLAFFGGAGLILYAAGWALVPEEDRARAPVHLDERSRTIALVALGVIAALALVGDSWGAYWFPWPLAIIGLIAFIWLSRSRDRAEQRSAPAGTTPSTPAYGQSMTGWVGPSDLDDQPAGPAPTYTYAGRPPDPRKRGPKLFWFTLLLIAFLEGVLGIVDAAGAPVADSAYAALPVAVIATLLIVGSVMGRAGGLIALGLVGSLFLVGATAAHVWDGETIRHDPSSAAEVADSYGMDGGELIVDLTGVEDVEGLDGRTIELTGNVGRIEVVIPDGVDAEVTADIEGPGGYDLFDTRNGGGFGSRVTESYDGGRDVPTLTIDAELDAGEISIDTE